MPRIKTCAQKKRKKPDDGSSSSRGTTRYPINMRADHRPIYDNFSKTKVIRPNVVIAWDILEQFNVREGVEELLQDPAWMSLLSIEEKIYQELTLTFLSTFAIRDKYEQGLDNEVEFLAAGEYRRMSMAAFIEALGIYEPDFIRSLEFAALPLWFPQGTHTSAFWGPIGAGQYNASTTKGSSLNQLRYRVMHYILARSTTDRVMSEGVVNARDVFQLWSMRTGTRVNVGVFAAFCMLRQSEQWNKGVFVGAWITRLLKNLELFPIREPADCIGRSTRLTAAPFVSWGYRGNVEGGEEDEDDEEEDAPEPEAEDIPGPDMPVPEGPTRGSEPTLAEMRATMMDMNERLKSVQEEQRRIVKKQKGIKKFLVKCFNKLGEALKIDFSSCMSSDDDHDDDEVAAAHGQAGGSTSAGLQEGSD